MEPEFWLERWREKKIGFNLDQPHPLLIELWPRLKAERNSKVLVPLCGKTVDMIWLQQQGHSVLGVELSRIAVESFFQEHGLTPSIEEVTPFTVFRCEQIEIRCGDIFNLGNEHLTEVDLVYDRASLVAFPPLGQERYVSHLTSILPMAARLLLITLEYDSAEMAGPPFSITHARIQTLFESRYHLSLLRELDALVPGDPLSARGLTWLRERAYLLEPVWCNVIC